MFETLGLNGLRSFTIQAGCLNNLLMPEFNELRRTKEPYEVLVAVVDRFPTEHLMRYNLACYSCQFREFERGVLVAGEIDRFSW